MADEVKEVVVEEEVTAPTGPPPVTIQMLIENLDGPGEEQITAWKAKYGEVFVTAISEDEVFIWRALKRREYRELQIKQANPENQMDQLAYEEAVCSVCVLWPTDMKYAEEKGGLATTLAEQIMQNSDFFNPAQAAALVVKL